MDLEEELFGDNQSAADYLPHAAAVPQPNLSTIPSISPSQFSPLIWSISVKLGKAASVVETAPSLPTNMFIAHAAVSLGATHAEYLKLIVRGKVIASDDPRSVAEIGLKAFA
uniref:Uncharacterized protein n=2 Tax=Octactis speculum TaxID=3111310 RepID=A0A7S2FVW6_9STRA|mmetsp:Transcript_32615/g.44125  ORF Transcript_32615/g.44125 Transcript_32615/m.44125 type:complete len:112 (+) Transcript_32615:174-509(+)